MIVEELIKLLEKEDPNLNINIIADYGNEGDIVEVKKGKNYNDKNEIHLITNMCTG